MTAIIRVYRRRRHGGAGAARQGSSRSEEPDSERAARIRRHVGRLAGATGERSVRRPGTLEAAADYIYETWAGQRYRAHGRDCRNL